MQRGDIIPILLLRCHCYGAIVIDGRLLQKPDSHPIDADRERFDTQVEIQAGNRYIDG